MGELLKAGILGYQLPPPRCRMYGSIPLARLQPKTLYNTSWSSPAMALTPSPQSPALLREGSQHPSKNNAAALQAPVAAPRPDLAPTAWLEVTHSGHQGPLGALKPQGELRT